MIQICPIWDREILLVCYMDSDSWVIEINVYRDIATDLEEMYDTINNDEISRYSSLATGKTKQVFRLIKKEIGVKTKSKFEAATANTNTVKI